MTLVSTKCPSCGGEIQVDNERKSGFCLYCGSQIDVKQALNQQTNLTGSEQDVENWKAVFDTYCYSYDYAKAEKVADKILQARPNDSDAIYRYNMMNDAKKLNIDKFGTVWGFMDDEIYDEEIYIPLGVKKIKSKAFENNTFISKVVFPKSLTVIEEEAFAMCTGLIDCNMSEGILAIGECAFGGCEKLVDLLIPGNISNSVADIFEIPKHIKEKIEKEKIVQETKFKIMEIIRLELVKSDYLVFSGEDYGMTQRTIIASDGNYDVQIKPVLPNERKKYRFEKVDEDEGSINTRSDIRIMDIDNFVMSKYDIKTEDPKVKIKNNVCGHIADALNKSEYLFYDGYYFGMVIGSIVVETDICDVQIKLITPRMGEYKYQKDE